MSTSWKGFQGVTLITLFKFTTALQSARHGISVKREGSDCATFRSPNGTATKDTHCTYFSGSVTFGATECKLSLCIKRWLFKKGEIFELNIMQN
jgi:hypothetical protein